MSKGLEVGTPRKVIVNFKDSTKSDISFCAICSCSTETYKEAARRYLLFAHQTDFKTEFCLNLEKYLSRTFTLQHDSRCVCHNCYRRFTTQINKWVAERKSHERARELYRERIHVRVKRGRRDGGLAGRSVKSLNAAFGEAQSSERSLEEDETDVTLKVEVKQFSSDTVEFNYI